MVSLGLHFGLRRRRRRWGLSCIAIAQLQNRGNDFAADSLTVPDALAAQVMLIAAAHRAIGECIKGNYLLIGGFNGIERQVK